MTTAAGAPDPLPLAEYKPGPTVAIWTVPVETVPAPLVMVTVARPLAVCAGIRKSTCPGDTKAMEAGITDPALSVTDTVVPPREVGQLVAGAA
jgi:hypothetical protein